MRYNTESEKTKAGKLKHRLQYRNGEWPFRPKRSLASLSKRRKLKQYEEPVMRMSTKVAKVYILQ